MKWIFLVDPEALNEWLQKCYFAQRFRYIL